jgi:hypothetical protein
MNTGLTRISNRFQLDKDTNRTETLHNAANFNEFLGDHLFKVLALFASNSGSPGTVIESNQLVLHIEDQSLIQRVWGPEQQGVRVYGERFGRGGALFMSIAPGFHLTISDDDGPLPGSEAQSNLYKLGGGSSGPSVCTPALPVGKVLTIDRSAKAYGLLPSRPGTYKLVVTWSPYKTKYGSCEDVPPYNPKAPTERPFVTVSSVPLTIHITGEKASDGVPEYTGWRSKFHFSDTAVGEKTALLDLSTHMEWLRLSLTQGMSEEAITAMMQPGDIFGMAFCLACRSRNVLRKLHRKLGWAHQRSID